MQKTDKTEEKNKEEEAMIVRMHNYLSGYALNSKLLSLERYEKEFFGEKLRDFEALGEGPLARARMFEIRHFIMGMKNCDEKLLLYYHYIKAEPVERCAELLGVSRSTAFRMKRRGLIMAAREKTKHDAELEREFNCG